MKLPTWIRAVCKADGQPLKGTVLQLTIRVRRKNDFTVPFGPTGEGGEALISLPDIRAWAELERGLFPMDFTGLGDATGEIVVSAKSGESVRAALAAYQTFHQGVPYPVGYADGLRESLSVLDRIAPATLSVDVEHDGEGVSVRTADVAA